MSTPLTPASRPDAPLSPEPRQLLSSQYLHGSPLIGHLPLRTTHTDYTRLPNRHVSPVPASPGRPSTVRGALERILSAGAESRERFTELLTAHDREVADERRLRVLLEEDLAASRQEALRYRSLLVSHPQGQWPTEGSKAVMGQDTPLDWQRVREEVQSLRAELQQCGAENLRLSALVDQLEYDRRFNSPLGSMVEEIHTQTYLRSQAVTSEPSAPQDLGAQSQESIPLPRDWELAHTAYRLPRTSGAPLTPSSDPSIRSMAAEVHLLQRLLAQQTAAADHAAVATHRMASEKAAVTADLKAARCQIRALQGDLDRLQAAGATPTSLPRLPRLHPLSAAAEQLAREEAEEFRERLMIEAHEGDARRPFVHRDTDPSIFGSQTAVVPPSLRPVDLLCLLEGLEGTTRIALEEAESLAASALFGAVAAVEQACDEADVSRIQIQGLEEEIREHEEAAESAHVHAVSYAAELERQLGGLSSVFASTQTTDTWLNPAPAPEAPVDRLTGFERQTRKHLEDFAVHTGAALSDAIGMMARGRCIACQPQSPKVPPGGSASQPPPSPQPPSLHPHPPPRGTDTTTDDTATYFSVKSSQDDGGWSTPSEGSLMDPRPPADSSVHPVSKTALNKGLTDRATPCGLVHVDCSEILRALMTERLLHVATAETLGRLELEFAVDAERRSILEGFHPVPVVVAGSAVMSETSTRQCVLSNFHRWPAGRPGGHELDEPTVVWPRGQSSLASPPLRRRHSLPPESARPSLPMPPAPSPPPARLPLPSRPTLHVAILDTCTHNPVATRRQDPVTEASVGPTVKIADSPQRAVLRPVVGPVRRLSGPPLSPKPGEHALPSHGGVGSGHRKRATPHVVIAPDPPTPPSEDDFQTPPASAPASPTNDGVPTILSVPAVSSPVSLASGTIPEAPLAPEAPLLTTTDAATIVATSSSSGWKDDNVKTQELTLLRDQVVTLATQKAAVDREAAELRTRLEQLELEFDIQEVDEEDIEFRSTLAARRGSAGSLDSDDISETELLEREVFRLTHDLRAAVAQHRGLRQQIDVLYKSLNSARMELDGWKTEVRRKTLREATLRCELEEQRRRLMLLREMSEGSMQIIAEHFPWRTGADGPMSPSSFSSGQRNFSSRNRAPSFVGKLSPRNRQTVKFRQVPEEDATVANLNQKLQEASAVEADLVAQLCAHQRVVREWETRGAAAVDHVAATWGPLRTLLGADFALLSDTPFVCVSTDVGSSLDSLRDFVRRMPVALMLLGEARSRAALQRDEANELATQLRRVLRHTTPGKTHHRVSVGTQTPDPQPLLRPDTAQATPGASEGRREWDALDAAESASRLRSETDEATSRVDLCHHLRLVVTQFPSAKPIAEQGTQVTPHTASQGTDVPEFQQQGFARAAKALESDETTGRAAIQEGALASLIPLLDELQRGTHKIATRRKSAASLGCQAAMDTDTKATQADDPTDRQRAEEAQAALRQFTRVRQREAVEERQAAVRRDLERQAWTAMLAVAEKGWRCAVTAPPKVTLDADCQAAPPTATEGTQCDPAEDLADVSTPEPPWRSVALSAAKWDETPDQSPPPHDAGGQGATANRHVSGGQGDLSTPPSPTPSPQTGTPAPIPQRLTQVAAGSPPSLSSSPSIDTPAPTAQRLTQVAVPRVVPPTDPFQDPEATRSLITAFLASHPLLRGPEAGPMGPDASMADSSAAGDDVYQQLAWAAQCWKQRAANGTAGSPAPPSWGSSSRPSLEATGGLSPVLPVLEDTHGDGGEQCAAAPRLQPPALRSPSTPPDNAVSHSHTPSAAILQLSTTIAQLLDREASVRRQLAEVRSTLYTKDAEIAALRDTVTPSGGRSPTATSPAFLPTKLHYPQGYQDYGMSPESQARDARLQWLRAVTDGAEGSPAPRDARIRQLQADRWELQALVGHHSSELGQLHHHIASLEEQAPRQRHSTTKTIQHRDPRAPRRPSGRSPTYTLDRWSDGDDSSHGSAM